jgi:hypothetical protein
MNQPDKNDINYDRLWKMRAPTDKLNDAYAKFYIQSEYLSLDEVVVLFKGRVILK